MKNLFKKMSEHGYTQESLADKLNITRQTVYNMIHSPEYFASDRLNSEMCDLFKCSILDIYSADEILKIKPKNRSEVEKIIKMIKEEYGNI